MISNKSKKIEKFEEIKINFYAKFSTQNQQSLITRLKFNNHQLCPDEYEENGCARFEMLTNGTEGRWDGILTLYPRQKNSMIEIELEFDEVSFALGVSKINL